ncbi:MAG TPA: winged helix-turn-helix domain-containing protein [Gemmatimonadaceae bacterium]
MSRRQPAVSTRKGRTVEEVAERLRQRLLGDLYLGSLDPGARLPSLRQLAAQYRVDVRVARRAYQVLERQGLVVMRQRSGVFFAPAQEGARAPLSPRVQWLVNLAVDGLARAVPVPELPSRVAHYTDAMHLRVACIECNKDQTSALCAELARAFGVKAVPFDIDALLASSTLDRDLKDIDLLITTPFHTGEIRELAARTGHAWLSMAVRADSFGEIAQLMPHGPVYYAVADPRFARKLDKIFGNTPYRDRFIPLVVDEPSLPAVDPKAPLFATQLARERLERSVAARAPVGILLCARIGTGARRVCRRLQLRA